MPREERGGRNEEGGVRKEDNLRFDLTCLYKLSAFNID